MFSTLFGVNLIFFNFSDEGKETQYIVQSSKEQKWHLSLNLSDSKALSNVP